jgi:hypothetical protein
MCSAKINIVISKVSHYTLHSPYNVDLLGGLGLTSVGMFLIQCKFVFLMALKPLARGLTMNIF